MSVLVVLFWQLTVMFLAVVALVNLLCAGWWDVLAAKTAPAWNKLIDALLELEK